MYWKHLKVNIFALICIDSRRCLRRHSRKKKIPREKITESVPTALGLFDFLAYRVPLSLHLNGRCLQKKILSRPSGEQFIRPGDRYNICKCTPCLCLLRQETTLLSSRKDEKQLTSAGNRCCLLDTDALSFLPISKEYQKI